VNRLSLNTKLWLALLITWVGLLGLGGWAAWQSRATMLAERKSAVQNVVESAYGIVADYAQRADQHELSPEQAQQQAMARLSAMRYPGNGYMIVTTATPVVIMHPVLADLRNKDVSHYADTDGKLLFVEMVKVAKAQGQGFVAYMARLPGKSEHVPKISFVKRFPAWDWYLISGVYVNDIDVAFRADLLRYLLTILVIGGFSTVALVLIIRNVKRSLGGEPAYAASVAETIAEAICRGRSRSPATIGRACCSRCSACRAGSPTRSGVFAAAPKRSRSRPKKLPRAISICRRAPKNRRRRSAKRRRAWSN